MSSKSVKTCLQKNLDICVFTTLDNCMDDELSPILSNGLSFENKLETKPLFVCESCDFRCFKKYNLKRHESSDKHKKMQYGDVFKDKNTTRHAAQKQEQQQRQEQQQIIAQHPIAKQEQQVSIATHICSCGKKYKHSQGLSKHRLVCAQKAATAAPTCGTESQNDLINYLIKENAEFKTMILEIVKKDTLTMHMTNNNTHNKTFNLNFFLNETCKDAMNIMDFVNSLKLQLSDFENVGKIGFVEGISNIIVKHLHSLDESKRPIHCTDTKREVMYVKDDDKWEKENEEKKKIRNAIKHVVHKNTKLLTAFKAKYPGCEKSSSKFSDQYDNLIVEAFGGKGDNDLEKEDKIIRNIAREVAIVKSAE